MIVSKYKKSCGDVNFILVDITFTSLVYFNGLIFRLNYFRSATSKISYNQLLV